MSRDKAGVVTATLIAAGSKKLIEEGVFVSAGLGLNPSSGRVERHFYLSTWKGRFSRKHLPPKVVSRDQVVFIKNVSNGNNEKY